MTRKLFSPAFICTALIFALGCGGEATQGSAQEAKPPAIAAPEGQRWSDITAITEAGGFLLGNPNAPVKIIEFASLTCPHCATFSAESKVELKRDYIDNGRVSLEFRNFTMNALDAAAAAVTHCEAQATPTRFFPLTEAVFAGQNELFRGAQANQESGQQALALPPEKRFVALAKAWQIDQFFQSLGVTDNAIAQCLSNVDNIERLATISNDSIEQYKITGTPSFVINGALATGVSTWPALRSRLNDLGVR